jgi:lysozyme family protein
MTVLRNISSKARNGFLLAISLLLAFGSAISFPTSHALAAPPDLEEYVSSNSLKHVQRWLAGLQVSLTKASELEADYQNLFMEAGWQGVDTTTIAAALATFEAQINLATPYITTADAVLATHDGFDDNGNVTDKAAAKITYQTAKQALKNARTILIKAGKDYSNAVRKWEKANSVVVRIENNQVAFINNQNWLAKQQTDLDNAAVVISNVEVLIVQAKAKGFGTGLLTSSLTTFEDQVPVAQASHTTAANILLARLGFDASGNVVDVDAASATTHTSGQALYDARKALGQSGKLMRSLDKWRAQIGFKTTSSIYPTYKLAYNSAVDLYTSVRAENSDRLPTLDGRLAKLQIAFAKKNP